MVDVWEILGLNLTNILATCAFVLFVYFTSRLKRSRRIPKEFLPFLGLAVIFLCFGIAFIIAGWFDYFQWEDEFGITIIGMYKAYIVALLGSIAAIGFLIENVWKKTYYLITCYVTGGIIYILFLNDYAKIALASIVFSGPLLLIALFLWYFLFIKPTSGFLRQRMVLALVGVFSLAVGFAARNSLITKWLGIPFYSLGTLVSIIGLCLIGYGFAAFSTFTDLQWKEKLRELFVISKGGICLYAFSFEKNLPLENSDLLAGGFSGIQALLSEIVKTSESLHLIDYQTVKILLTQSAEVMFVLVIKEESTFLQYKLQLFSEEFQTFFKDILPRWKGEMDIFKLTITLVQRVFEL